jgi:putative phosphoesterase
MRIAVFSDTHDRYPPGLPKRMKGADEIWHLGDVCAPETLKEFEQLGRPLHVVMGNCDAFAGWPLVLTLEREGVRFYLTHIPPARLMPGITTVLHGHTHVARDEVVNGVRWLNPGCITRPKSETRPSFAWLEVHQGKPLDWTIERL